MKNRTLSYLSQRLFSSVLLQFVFVSLLPVVAEAKESEKTNIKIHSHNDYRRVAPFYQAYAHKLFSIEVDVFHRTSDNALLVAHDLEELPTALTIQELYLDPIITQFKRNDGKIWKDSEEILQLMVDMKSSYKKTLPALVKLLEQHPSVFDHNVNPNAVRVVISGSMPPVDEFEQYPDYIFFDGRFGIDYSEKDLERIAMISTGFRDHSIWNGKGGIIAKEKAAIEKLIATAHQQGKPVRFWGTPDGITAWNTFYHLGVDIINTDKPESCVAFFSNFERKNYVIADRDPVDENSDNLVKVSKLDKLTVGFSGFKNSELQLFEPVPLYTPTFENDGEQRKPKNVILLIGDGMGIAQMSVAEFANNGLTMTKLLRTAFVGTQAKDYYSADSAGAGSSIATGESNSNRHISMSETGEPYPSMTDHFAEEGYACGIVTMGNLADATPAAFYGHTTERDDTDEITNYLLDGKLTLLAGSGMKTISGREDAKEFMKKLSDIYRIEEHTDRINDKEEDRVICVDERMGKAATRETISLLAEITEDAIEKMENQDDSKGFFMMVEAAKIDYAGHANSLPAAVVETLAFDLAVAEALRFADEDGETLVIVTSDHETGGLTIVDGDNNTRAITATFMTDDHTGIKVPLFAYGPGSDNFIGTYHNTMIWRKIKELMQF